MKPATRKLVAGIAAFAFVVFNTVGAHFITKAKDKTKAAVISKCGGTTLRDRYWTRFTDMRDRDLSDPKKLRLTDDWIEAEYWIEEHDASHLHHDFSIVANGKVWRVARTPSSSNRKSGFLGLFPSLQEKTGWILQPEHLVGEVPNPPFIDDGYGAGSTIVLAQGKCMVRMSDSGNLEAVFDCSDGVFTFVHKDNKEVLMIRKYHQGPAIMKHKMKAGKIEDLTKYTESDEYIFVAKYDGAHADWKVVKGSDGNKYLNVWSWRQDAKLHKKYGVDNQIEHTYRLEVCHKKLPSEFPLCEGRAELFMDDVGGPGLVTSILNTGLFRVLHESPRQPELIVHDITKHERYRGDKLDAVTYEEKLLLIEELNALDSRFKIPRYSDVTPKSKMALWDDCLINGNFDGVIAWKLNSPGTKGTKLKFKHDESHYHDAYIVALEPQSGQHGDKYSYPVVMNQGGAVFKISGKGLTNERKADMFNNPENYIGSKLVYSAERHFEESELPFQPVIVRFENG